MANKKINELSVRTPSLSDLMLVGDPTTGYSYKATISSISTLLEANIALNDLSDVVISSPSSGNLLAYNGTNWVNRTLGSYLGGTITQYVRGDGSLGDFAGGGGGGGASVSYYLNGSVNQGTFGGATYYEMNKTPIVGAGTNFSINANGYIASFITDAGDPALLKIPGGNWNLEFYFSASSSGGTPSFYVELYKYDGTIFTLLASTSATPEGITNGTAIDAYFTSISVPETVLTLTDRLAIRVYVTHSGRTITLHTENSHLCQIITTFTTGLTALNNLTAQVQFFATGTSGTDFNISSTTATHTFNLPTASATNRGALSSADWTTFNGKVGGSGTTNYISKFTASGTIGNSQIFDNGTSIGIGTATPSASFKLDVNGATRIQGNVQFPWTDTKVSWLFDASYEAGMRMTTATRTLDIFSKSGDGNDEITFSTGATPTEKMRITNGGNVGIGTISPSFLLDVNGTAKIGAALTISGATTFANSVWNTSTDGRERLYFTTNSITYLKGDGVVLRNNSNTDVLTITSTGNTLIGTSTDGGYRLDVSGTARVSGTELRLDNGTTGVINLYSTTPSIQFASFDPTNYRIYRSGTTMLWNSAGNIKLQIAGNDAYQVDASNGHIWRTALSGGAALARLTTGGNMIIGSTTDAGTGKLQISGDMALSAYSPIINLISSAGAGGRIYWNDGSNRFALGYQSIQGGEPSGSLNLYSWGAGGTILSITGGGQVLIGVPYPIGTNYAASAQLEVASTSRGFLPPRMTGAQAEAITGPAAGLMVYANNGNGTTITSTGWWGYNGSGWVKLN